MHDFVSVNMYHMIFECGCLNGNFVAHTCLRNCVVQVSGEHLSMLDKLFYCMIITFITSAVSEHICVQFGYVGI